MGKYHDKGEQDYQDKDYSPPYDSPSEKVHAVIPGRTDEEIADRKDYDAGWRNARKQD